MKNKLNFGQENSQENHVIVIYFTLWAIVKLKFSASVTLNKSFTKQLELFLLDALEKVAL